MKNLFLTVITFVASFLCGRAQSAPVQLSQGGGANITVNFSLPDYTMRDTGNTFYILDEPTTGLHFEDVRILLEVLNKLVERGNTVVVIEHNLDVIKSADYLIDLGPDGGKGGGQVVASGTPEEVAKNKNSYTGQFLKEVL